MKSYAGKTQSQAPYIFITDQGNTSFIFEKIIIFHNNYLCTHYRDPVLYTMNIWF